MPVSRSFALERAQRSQQERLKKDAHSLMSEPNRTVVNGSKSLGIAKAPVFPVSIAHGWSFSTDD